MLTFLDSPFYVLKAVKRTPAPILSITTTHYRTHIWRWWTVAIFRYAGPSRLDASHTLQLTIRQRLRKKRRNGITRTCAGYAAETKVTPVRAERWRTTLSTYCPTVSQCSDTCSVIRDKLLLITTPLPSPLIPPPQSGGQGDHALTHWWCKVVMNIRISFVFWCDMQKL